MQKVKAKMQNPELMFQKALQIKHCSSNSQIVMDVTKSTNPSEVKKEENENNNALDEDIDYANIFNTEVKKE